ncbi:MAG TPA: glycoside hydrolase domain-containing protein [Phycisphaerae bacterium]|nr:glycoside hydrolase domain-containing protein [Phycisphaerae bacterium]
MKNIILATVAAASVLSMAVTSARANPPAPASGLAATVPHMPGGWFYYASNYGELLSAPGESVTVWWCDGTRKVPRKRLPPVARAEAVRLESARNEFEAAQIIVHPGRELAGLTARVSELAGPGGARIAGDDIRLLRVAYVRADVPTDKRGLADWWPDPLPPLDTPVDVPAGENQPLWLLVRVPTDAPAGDYHGKVTLEAEGFTFEAQVRLHVWDFALPEKPFTASAFGLSLHRIAQYHGLKSEQDKRTVFAKYMQSFAEHRISPYDPVPLDAIGFTFRPDTDPPRCDVDFSKFDPAMEEAVRKYHITSFMLPVPGMGGGSFHDRTEGEAAGFKAGSPRYEAMMSSMLGRVQGHLAAKGWLDMAYIYWFDEPEEKDYAFVREGMERLKKYAPNLRRMLTEEPVPALFGAVDLWCPLSHHYDPELGRQRRAAGDDFWWYVCTGPKAPYCTLFIDHPATALRVWMWQTWQRRISGILIWETVYWTSQTAFPDSLQNPYEDAMGYRTGYGQKPGTRAYWGNGDGRFLYPPLAAAAGSDKPVLDGPVSSLRWEILRDGVEDVDYLHLLKAAIDSAGAATDPKLLEQAGALLDVPQDITQSMRDWTFDSRPILEHRSKVAEMIERLSVGRSGS